MKEIVIIILLTISLVFSLFSKEIEGQIIYDNDTVDVIFKIPLDLRNQQVIYESIQRKIKYIDSLGANKVLKPEDAKEFRFKFEENEIRMKSLKKKDEIKDILFFPSKFFIKLEFDKEFKVFKYYSNASSGNTNHLIKKYIIQNRNGKMILVKSSSFVENMVDCFSDCEELVSMIKNHDYVYRDIETIFEYYNLFCH